MARLAVVLYLLFAPLSTASVFIGGRRVEFSLLLASLLALWWLAGFLTLRIGVSREGDGWSFLFWLFVGWMAASLLASAYLSESWVLGVIQLVGMAVVLLASMYVSRSAAERPGAYAAYARVLTWAVVLIAAVGAWQFFAFNVLGVGFLADFSWVNDLTVGPGAREMVWRDPGNMGPLRRANSVLAEPAFFAQTLGMVGGVMLLRLGLMGRSLGSSLSGVVPRWAAFLVLVGFAVALSIVGYILLVLTVASLVALLTRFDLRSLLRMLFAGTVTVVLGGLLILVSGEAFVNKLKTIPLVYSAATGGVQTLLLEQVSALVLAANVSVALGNLEDYPLLGVGPGGHPPSYDVLVLSWVRTIPDIIGISQEDGGALLIRLLSETGVIGTALFLLGWLIVVLRARRAIQRALAFHRNDRSRPSAALAAAVGVTASCMALFVVYLLRMAIYYDPVVWLPIALTAAVPPLLNREYGGFKARFGR